MDKFKKIALKIIYWIFVISILIFFTYSLTYLFIYPFSKNEEKISKTPINKEYAKDLVFDEWKDVEYGFELNTKSFIYSDYHKLKKKVVTEVMVDSDYEYLLVTIKDWETGEIIHPFDKEEDNLTPFDTIVGLLDIFWVDSILYEATIWEDFIEISEESCDSRGLEELENIKGGCFFLDEYEKNDSSWYTMRVYFKNGEHLILSL